MSLITICPKRFSLAVFVIGYDLVCGFQNALSGTVILFNLTVRIGIIALKVEYIAKVSLGIGRLTGRRRLRRRGCEMGSQLLTQHILRAVGILILINVSIVKALLIFLGRWNY